ncbi:MULTISPECIES: diacylglycerol kinase family protein [Bacillus]|uniref:diacylglycerol kinase family protein n=1 Tax=Bacillus TaxID=1386 RepID=UPI0002FA2CAE|nr:MULTISPECIES: diacylglycerol kinase family protein [Bacillus]
MAYRGSNKKFPFSKSVKCAFEGIGFSLQERNVKIHLCVAVLVIIAGLYFSISRVEWLFIITCIAGMFALELMNTAIEKVVDLVTNDYHPLAKMAKDISAGAVLIYTFYSIIVGIIIFLPKILNILLEQIK